MNASEFDIVCRMKFVIVLQVRDEILLVCCDKR